MVKELIKEKEPAKGFITNPVLLEQWESELDAADCEADWDNFCKAINVWCTFHPEYAPPLNAEETDSVLAALKMERGQPVLAKRLQEWIGERKFESCFREVCPDYEERVSSERMRKEAASRAATEADAAAAAPASAAGAAAPPPEPAPPPAAEAPAA